MLDLRGPWWRGACMGPIRRAMAKCCAALVFVASADPGRSSHIPQIVSRPMPPKKRSAAQLAAASKGSKATAAKHRRIPAAAAEEPVLESNGEVQGMLLDEPTDHVAVRSQWIRICSPCFRLCRYMERPSPVPSLNPLGVFSLPHSNEHG